MLLPREIHYSYALPSMVKLKKVTVNQNLEEIIMKLESKKYQILSMKKVRKFFYPLMRQIPLFTSMSKKN